ncbi:hypothetical protein HETIRDRAFT_469470 [Heterobasidion irregulare TC 32-1]|uniref:Uncharacterized protein n=1 Tax=Heterobasidion irregulare (strain TC 32-1) TaxID=747525 RepID=W4KPU3_HETIT|nr:uncharacterized protein HETIRDRAFT_469470 [Heterobasidion irregulare TC 32-1]ETW87848.1 hypothetical protein HETIRDRAFT_469470 [Heterobasidion irregulare TC 32-1]
MSSPVHPPYYVLISHSCQLTSTSTPLTSLSHPIIQYHYADDSPLSLLPRSLDEHVLMLDYNPSDATIARIQSLGGNFAVTRVKVTDAPGACTSEEELNRNNNMYILETTALGEDKSLVEGVDPQAILARFKQRNTVIRQVLDYCEPQSSLSGLRDNTLKPHSP